NYVLAFLDGVEMGRSLALTVEPGPADQLRLSTSKSMTAGEADGFLSVYMQDADGNDVDSYGTEAPDLELEQHVAVPVEGPDPLVYTKDCTKFTGGQADCRFVGVTLADPNVTITARDGSGRLGQSESFPVFA